MGHRWTDLKVPSSASFEPLESIAAGLRGEREMSSHASAEIPQPLFMKELRRQVGLLRSAGANEDSV